MKWGAFAVLLAVLSSSSWAQQDGESPQSAPLSPSFPQLYSGAVPVLMWGVYPGADPLQPGVPTFWPVWVIPVAPVIEAVPSLPPPSPREAVAVTGSIQDEAASSHPIALASPLVGELPKHAPLRKPVLPKSHSPKKPLEKVARKKRKLCWRDGELGVCP